VPDSRGPRAESSRGGPPRADGAGPARLDLIIAGAQKAGTTSLLAYLAHHPRVTTQRQPELNYLVNPTTPRSAFTDVAGHYFGPDAAAGTVVVGKLAGLMYEPEGMAKLRREQPGVRAVVVLREPVARAYSAYLHARARGREPLDSFEEALAADPARFGADENSRRICAYLDRSLYARHLRTVFAHLGRDAVEVVFLEDLTADPRAVAGQVLSPWGLDPDALPARLPRENPAREARSSSLAALRRGPGRALRRALPGAARDRLRRAYRSLNELPTDAPGLEPDVQHRLRARLAPANAELAELLGVDLARVWPGATG
jgi:Sulfotransferase domain